MLPTAEHFALVVRPAKLGGMSSIRAAVAGALAVAGLWAGAAVANAEPTPAPAPPPAPKTTIEGNGTYQVGVDIAPGVYKSAGPIDGGACYWKRLNGDAMVDNGLTKKAPVVTIDPTDTTFRTSDCQTWQMTDCSQVDCKGPSGLPPGALGPLLSILGGQINPGATAPGPPPASAAPAPAPAG